MFLTFSPVARCLCVLFLSAFIAIFNQSVAGLKAIDTPSPDSVVAKSTMQVGITAVGDRVITYGERGVVLVSSDQGDTWVQADVPVSVTLTDMDFVTDQIGWAVGHSGAVLKTTDGGHNWKLVLDGERAARIELKEAETQGEKSRIESARFLVEDGADKPFLSVEFVDEQSGYVAGAYGLVFKTTDGGETWRSLMGKVQNPMGMHIYDIAVQGSHAVLVGEQGLIVEALDGAETFEAAGSPYEGTLFAATFTASNTLIVAGLRGKLFYRNNGDRSFQQIDNAVPVSIERLLSINNGYLAVNHAGQVLGASKPSEELTILHESRLPITGIAHVEDKQWVASTFVGPARVSFELPPQEGR